MGKLVQLELDNFKSYAGKQIIGPFDNFSCIVGPNGAGKSNMMDAISFVLGVQSRHLRSNQLKELIFRKGDDGIRARSAYVKLLYELSNNELDNYLAGQRITFMRSVNASGVGSYRIDNKEVTYELYEKQLEKIGVLVKARNFLVFQGDIESVASKSPSELSKLFEQVSGSEHLSQEYNELLRKKEETDESTLFAMQKKKMFVTQCKEAKGQKDEADRYQQMRHEINRMKTEHVLLQIFQIKSEMDQQIVELSSLKDELIFNERIEQEIEIELAQEKKEIAKASKSLASAESEKTTLSKQITTITPKIAEAKGKMKSLNQRIQDLNQSETKATNDINIQSKQIEQLQKELQEINESEEKVRIEIQQGEGSELNLDNDMMLEYSHLRETVSSHVAAETAEERIIDLEIKSKQQQCQRLKDQSDSLREEMNGGEKMLVEYNERVTTLSNALANNTAERLRLIQQRDESGDEMRRGEAEMNSIRMQINDIQLKLREAGDDKRRSKQEERMNEAIETMKRLFNGVHGKLVDLCRPIQKKFAQAIAVAAGKQMDAIVVDTKQTATDCIRYLRDQRIGTCLFLPLDNLTVKPISERLRSLGLQYKLCIDLLEFDDRYRSAILYAIGSTVVCDTLEEARELCFKKGEKVNVVTLRGHIINKSGAMTGGSMTKDGNTTNRWVEKDLDKLRNEKNSLEEQLQNIQSMLPNRQQLIEWENRIQILETQINYNRADLKVSQDKILSLEQQKQLRVTSINQMQKNLTTLTNDINNKQVRVDQLRNKIRDVENQIFADFSHRMGVDNIREYEENHLKRHQEHFQRFAVLTKQRAMLMAQLEYIEKQEYLGVLQRMREQIVEAKRSLNELDEELNQLLNKEMKLQENLQHCQTKVTSSNEARQTILRQHKGNQLRRNEIANEKINVTKKIVNAEILIEKSRGKLHEVLQKAQVDEVALPVTNKKDSKQTKDFSSNSLPKSRTASKLKTSSSKRMIAVEEKDDGSDEDDDENDDEDNDEDLQWTGNVSSHEVTNIPSRRMIRKIDTSNVSSTSSSSHVTSHGESLESSITNSAHFSQADNATVLRDQLKAAVVDLSSLRRKYRGASNQKLKEKERELDSEIVEATANLESKQPNMHAGERYEAMNEKLKECNKELEDMYEATRIVTTRYEEVKSIRQNLFQDCYDHVSKSLGVIYRDLTKSSKHPLGGNAYLTLDNTEEPYLGGIRFTAMPPMKRFRDMEQLSGGEKTMAALALLFSIHSYRQAPFFVLDEVDAALDNVNVKKICNYIRQRSQEFQCIVISLKDMFFEHADCLVGICKDIDLMSSQVLTLDLSNYDDIHSGSSSTNESGEKSTDGSRVSSMEPSPSASSREDADFVRQNLGQILISPILPTESKERDVQPIIKSSRSKTGRERVKRVSVLKKQAMIPEEEENDED